MLGGGDIIFLVGGECQVIGSDCPILEEALRFSDTIVSTFD